MKYRLNKLPVKTTNGFKINDIEVDINIPEVNSFNEFVINNSEGIIIDKCIKNSDVSSRIGLEFSRYLELNITVPKNKKIKNTVFINYNFNNKDNLIDKINIIYQKNSSCNFIITYKSNGNDCQFHHLLECVEMNKKSSGNITIINLMNNNSNSFIAIETDNLESSKLTHNIIDLSGNIRINNVYSNVYNNSDNYLNNIYIGGNNDIIDMNYYLNNIGRNSVNKMIVEGVLDDNSVKNFRGTIDFLMGCTNSIGEESENCVLLSNSTRSRSLPQMLCHEENVEGSHGVSSGRIDKEKLFYIMSRGYSMKEAEKLIVMGNFTNILKSIPDENIINTIHDLISEKI